MVESENKQLKSIGENSWQRNRKVCVGCREERKHLNISYCSALGGKSGKQKAGPFTDPESKKQTKSLENSCLEDTKVIRKRERY